MQSGGFDGPTSDLNSYIDNDTNLIFEPQTSEIIFLESETYLLAVVRTCSIQKSYFEHSVGAAGRSVCS